MGKNLITYERNQSVIDEYTKSKRERLIELMDSFLLDFENDKRNFIENKINALIKQKDVVLDYIINDTSNEDIRLADSSDQEAINFILDNVEFNEKVIQKKIIPTSIIITFFILLLYIYLLPKIDYFLFFSTLILYPISIYNILLWWEKSYNNRKYLSKKMQHIINGIEVFKMYERYFEEEYPLAQKQMKKLKLLISERDYIDIIRKSGSDIKYKYVLPVVNKYMLEEQYNIYEENIYDFYKKI